VGLESAPSVDKAIEVQRDGVRAIQRITNRFVDSDWDKPTPCDAWNATDLAGHVFTVIDTWRLLLDDSESGRSSPRFGWSEMDAHFETALRALSPGSGMDRVHTFAERAEDYFDRLARLDPELPLVAALSDIATVPLTIGLFAWVGGNEWHIHAWDFAQVTGEDYRTEHAALINEGSLAIRGRTPADGDPWQAILSRWRS
jgi:uncharacterized protein (TIGR03083 family)